MHKLVKKFILEDSKNEKLFIRYKYKNDKKALDELEEKFESYYTGIKIISYIKKSITFCASTYWKEQFEQQSKENLTLNSINNNFEEENINLIKGKEVKFVEEVSKPSIDIIDFESFIENKRLLDALKKLPERQKEVIYKLVVLEQSENEVVKELHVSQQSINKSKNKALIKLKMEFKEEAI